MKRLRRLARAHERADSGLFLAEGEDLVRAADAAGRNAVEGFCAAGFDLGVEGFEEIEPGVLASISTLGSGTRAIGVYEQRLTEPRGPLCVYLHAVGDPGNVGTVLRGALAFGVSSVALGPGCADPHSPKAVRASMGAIFSVRIARVERPAELPGELVALVVGEGEPLWRIHDALPEGLREALAGSGPAGACAIEGTIEGTHTLARAREGKGLKSATHPTHHEPGGDLPAITLLVGAERDGLPREIVDACGRVAHIPIAGDSLNAAMASIVALYEIRRPSTRVPAS